MRQKFGKDKIVQAALHLFSKHGFHATSTTQIAELANVSKGLMYNYFKSKEELLHAIIETADADLADLSQHITASSTKRKHADIYCTSLRHFLEQYTYRLKNNKHFLALQFSLLFQPDLKSIVLTPLQDRTEKTYSFAEEIFLQAKIKNPALTAKRLVNELDGITVQYLSTYPNFPIDQTMEQVYEHYEGLKI